MQKLICKVALFKIGVERFEREVNTHLSTGWSLEEVSIVRKFLCFVCYAVVVRK